MKSYIFYCFLSFIFVWNKKVDETFRIRRTRETLFFLYTLVKIRIEIYLESSNRYYLSEVLEMNKSRKKPELLAPAGNMEALKAAILAGCDAVYLGGKHFGARSFAGNFDDEEMVEAIAYAHLYGVRVYVTMNTLIYEEEVNHFLNYIDFLYKNAVDAIIIQDIGMLDLVRQVYPDLELHASTQMHIHNEEGVQWMEELGLKRVVLARETPLSLIKKIKQTTNMELEIFIHGALCVSYSGQCLMSSLLNGRSGNRGTCSQCCRMPYVLKSNGQVISQEKYVLSPKDLLGLSTLKKLIDIGVNSLKIEGRMKRKEYVYVVTKFYRKAIDSYFEKGRIEMSEEEMESLQKIFNRGFTKGFLGGEESIDWIHEKRPNHMGIPIGKVKKVDRNLVTITVIHSIHQEDGIRILGNEEDIGLTLNKIYKNKKLVCGANEGEEVSFYVKGDVEVGSMVLLTTDAKQIKCIEQELQQEKRKVRIEGNLLCKENELSLTVSDGVNQVKEKSVFLPEKAKKTPTLKEKIVEQIKKTGNTVFYFSKLNYEIEEDLFVRIQALNELRRNALQKLERKRIYKKPYRKEQYNREVPTFNEEQGFVFYVQSQANVNHVKAEYIVDDVQLYKQLENKCKVYLRLPRVNEEMPIVDCDLLVSELGSFYKYKNKSTYTDFSFNVVNSYSVAFLHAMGAKRVTLSYELNDYQIKNIIDSYKKRYEKMPNLEYIVSSKPEVMVLKYNLLRDNKEGVLLDVHQQEYTVVKKGNFTIIYHSAVIEKENPEKYLELGITKIRYHL